MEYLATGLLADRLLPVALWTVLGSSGNAGGGQRMVLDATALSAIEVVETLEGRHDGSLLSFLDHTSTPMGYRLLRQWVCAPLYDLDDIHQRQDAVEFFIQHGDLSHQLRTSLKILGRRGCVIGQARVILMSFICHTVIPKLATKSIIESSTEFV